MLRWLARMQNVLFLRRFVARLLRSPARPGAMAAMKQLLLAALLIVSACATAQAASPGCPPAGYDRARLNGLSAAQWRIADDSARNALARSMLACLADPDTTYRDGLAFEALQHWMRADQLSHETLLAIGDELQGWLTAPEGEGFRRPFAALILAEVARTDRIHPWLTAPRRQSLLDASVAYLTNVRDYRGFDDHDGWRHGVAHGADLMVQLSLNPAFGKPELMRIREAVASQISPAGHFYIYGEPGRLSAAIIYMAQRKVFTADEWAAWLTQVASPAPLASWNDAFTHNADIARAENVGAFMRALYINTKLDANADDDVLLPGVEAALRSLP